MGYLIHLAWIRSRATSWLGSRPSYEARATLSARVELAVVQSSSLQDFGDRLFRSLDLRIGLLTTEDALWWRGACVEHATSWPALRQRPAVQEAIQLAALLDELLRDLKTTTPTEAT